MIPNMPQYFLLSFFTFFLLIPAGCGYDGPKITVEELRVRLDSPNQKMTVVDVRPSILFKKGHIPGAVNYPLENLVRTSRDLAALRGELAIICSQGKKSIAALDQLSNERIPAMLVEGGMEQWEAAGYPLDMEK
jgi:rhodanese-related sulfurtransferase